MEGVPQPQQYSKAVTDTEFDCKCARESNQNPIKIVE